MGLVFPLFIINFKHNNKNHYVMINYKENLANFLQKENLKLTSVKKYGKIIVIKYYLRLSSKIGKKLLPLFPDVTGIYQHLTTIGERREPHVIFLAGNDDPEVVHKENGVVYSFNIKIITFSWGNSALRIKLTKFLTQHDNLLDMFAAVGNLCIQPALSSKCTLIAIEKNPVAYQYLLKNFKSNKIYATSYNIDCRKILIINWASIIFMGYYDVDFTHCKAAVKASKNDAKIFIQALCVPKMEKRWKRLYTKWFTDLECAVLSVTFTKIKGYSPGLQHYQFVFVISKTN